MLKDKRNVLKEKLRHLVSLCYANKTFLFLALVIAAFFVFSFQRVLQAVIITSFIIIGGVSKIYQRYMDAAVGIELVMFSTITSGFVYGPLIGGLVGFCSFALATYFSGRFTFYVIPSIIIYTLAGIFAGSFSSVAVAGLTMTIIFIIILVYISIAFFRSRINRVVMFALTSFLWNFWIFIGVAPRIVSLLK